MATLNLIITTAGQAAIAQAGSLGPVVISKIAIGSGTWSTAPTPAATALNTQIKQLDPSGSETPSPGIIHITATDNSTDVYNVYEMGLYTSTGILFAIAGGTTLFLNKASGSSALFSIDLAITNVPSGSVVIGDAGFAYPPATETTQGVAEIATSAEVVAGLDDTRIVTPKKLNDANFLSKSGGTVTGTLNVTGALQVNGEVGYVLTDIVEQTIPHYGAINAGLTNALHTTAPFTKPAGELWVMEISLRYYGAAGYTYEFAGRYGSQTPQTGSYIFYERRHDGQGGGAVGNELYTCRWVVTSAETFTSETIKIDTIAGSGSGLQIGMQTGLAGAVCSGPVYPSKFRIYKYKTA